MKDDLASGVMAAGGAQARSLSHAGRLRCPPSAPHAPVMTRARLLPPTPPGGRPAPPAPPSPTCSCNVSRQELKELFTLPAASSGSEVCQSRHLLEEAGVQDIRWGQQAACLPECISVAKNSQPAHPTDALQVAGRRCRRQPAGRSGSSSGRLQGVGHQPGAHARGAQQLPQASCCPEGGGCCRGQRRRAGRRVVNQPGESASQVVSLPGAQQPHTHTGRARRPLCLWCNDCDTATLPGTRFLAADRQITHSRRADSTPPSPGPRLPCVPLQHHSDMAAPPGKAPSRELQQFIEREQQLAQVQQMIATLTEVCWDKCISSPGSYLSSRESSCVENCAKRFVDSTQYILQRAAHKAGDSNGF